MLEPRYPEIHVRLTGNDGNAFSVLGKVTAAMRKHNIPKEEITSFTDEAMSGDYNNLLRTCMRWVEVA